MLFLIKKRCTFKLKLLLQVRGKSQVLNIATNYLAFLYFTVLIILSHRLTSFHAYLNLHINVPFMIKIHFADAKPLAAKENNEVYTLKALE